MILTFPVLGFSQKIKLKNNIIYVDKKEFLKSEEDKIVKGNYTIYSLQGEKLFYIKLNSYKDPKEVDYKYNPDGNVSYYEVLSPDLSEVFFEVHPAGCLMGCYRPEEVIKALYNGNIISSEGRIDFEKLKDISNKIGFEYTKKRSELKITKTSLN